jgi:hypothetical protein
MASGTDLYLQILSEHRTGGKSIAATAGHSNLFVLWVNFWLHRFNLTLFTGYFLAGNLTRYHTFFGTKPQPGFISTNYFQTLRRLLWIMIFVNSTRHSQTIGTPMTQIRRILTDFLSVFISQIRVIRVLFLLAHPTAQP